MSIHPSVVELAREVLTAPLRPFERLRQHAMIAVEHSVDYADLVAVEDDQAFIIATYEAVLGRPAKEACVSTWLAPLKAKRITRADFITDLVESDEGKRRRVYVNGLNYVLAVERRGKPKQRRQKFLGIIRRKPRRVALGSEGFRTAVERDKRLHEWEIKLARLATDCIHALEDLQRQLQSQQVPAANWFVEPKDEDELLGEESGSALSQFYEQMQRLGDTRTKPALTSAIQNVVAKLPHVLTDPSWMKEWGYVGDSIFDIQQACESQRVELLHVQTPIEEIGYARSLGLNAHAIDSTSGTTEALCPVVLLKTGLSQLTDSQLVATIASCERMLRAGGMLAVLTTVDESAFDHLRVQAALESVSLSEISDSETLCEEASTDERLQLTIYQKTPHIRMRKSA